MRDRLCATAGRLLCDLRGRHACRLLAQTDRSVAVRTVVASAASGHAASGRAGRAAAPHWDGWLSREWLPDDGGGRLCGDAQRHAGCECRCGRRDSVRTRTGETGNADSNASGAGGQRRGAQCADRGANGGADGG